MNIKPPPQIRRLESGFLKEELALQLRLTPGQAAAAITAHVQGSSVVATITGTRETTTQIVRDAVAAAASMRSSQWRLG